MTQEQLEGLKEGDVLVWTELRGEVTYTRDDGRVDVLLDGSTYSNDIHPNTLLLAQVEERTLTGADVLRMLADGRKPEEFEWLNRLNGRWHPLELSYAINLLNDPSYQFRVKP